jgi:hypothetical protein
MTLRRTFLLTLLCGLTALLAPAATASDITGKWDLVFQTPVGERKATVDMTVEGTQVNGKMGETVLKGTYQDGKLELKGNLYSSEGGYSAELKLNGKVENDAITGTAIWDTYEMTFTAKRGQ